VSLISVNADKQAAAPTADSPFSQKVERAVGEISKALLGKDHQIRLALCCLFSGGHLLIEDLPGMGKTTLSYALARAMGLEFNRIQFTSDLLPADILGISIFDQNSGKFSFHPGPIFSQLVLARNDAGKNGTKKKYCADRQQNLVADLQSDG
jgi:MoxR-like ATPase